MTLQFIIPTKVLNNKLIRLIIKIFKNMLSVRKIFGIRNTGLFKLMNLRLNFPCEEVYLFLTFGL